jgi:hypothetical protein
VQFRNLKVKLLLRKMVFFFLRCVSIFFLLALTLAHQASAKSAECVDEAFMRTAELVYQKHHNVAPDVKSILVLAHCLLTYLLCGRSERLELRWTSREDHPSGQLGPPAADAALTPTLRPRFSIPLSANPGGLLQWVFQLLCCLLLSLQHTTICIGRCISYRPISYHIIS